VYFIVVVMVVGRLWFVVGVGCGVMVVVSSMIVFSELEQDEQGVLKYKTMMNDEHRSLSFGCHVAVGDVEPGSCDKE
jgi:hypothetical protein